MEDGCTTNETGIRRERVRGQSRRTHHFAPMTLMSSAIAAVALCLSAACGSDPGPAPVGTGSAAGAGAPTLPTTTGAGGSSATARPGMAGSTTPTTGTPSGGPMTQGMTPTTPSMTPGGTPGDVATGTETMPCGVSKVLASGCQNCHGVAPIGGAPMPLVTWADMHKPAKTQPAMKVYQVVQQRLHDEMRPMPPVEKLAAPDFAMLDAWLTAGALPGTAADAMCPTTGPTDGTVIPAGDGSRGRIVPGPGEECYEFTVHNGQTSETDATPYDVGGDGEHYEQFYYSVPWPADSVATSYGTIIDNEAVLHHWLLFATDEGDPPGSHKTAPLPTLIGTNPVLLAGWAVGGPNLVAPAHVGFELPNPGKTINVQWHFYNSTGTPQSDASAVQICVVPKSMRENVGGVTWMGTEDLNGNVWTGGPGMPAHQESSFVTECDPGRAGMAAGESIFIIGFEPHMHRIGKNMKTEAIKADGTVVPVFDKPFNFGHETHYYQDYELKPGERLRTTCSFNNDNDFGVPFGESSDTEMCYQFTFSYPAHALSNGAPSLLGVTDTCWGPNM
jgi:Copper type II ascorbate-dependent monooxygenase, C-terminal domain